MDGGGYHNFLNKVKTTPDSNCIAKFILVDLDKAKENKNEMKALNTLIQYCKEKNKSAVAPYFLIINNPDFEYIACLHVSGYRGQDTKRYIEKYLGYRNLNEYKGDKHIYKRLNSGNNSTEKMIERLRHQVSYIKNLYDYKKANFRIIVKDVIVNRDAEMSKGSNISELFEILHVN